MTLTGELLDVHFLIYFLIFVSLALEVNRGGLDLEILEYSPYARTAT